MTDQSVPFKPHFGAFILETLTLGMYGEARNAIREYIQNSFDALLQAVAEGFISAEDARVTVTLGADLDTLTIRDNGVGLRVENAVAVLASVGASNKDYRKNAGFRGIGRLAGIVFCDRLSFETKAKGQTKKTKVVFKAKELREEMSPRAQMSGDAAAVLEECVEAVVSDTTDVDDHFFEVRLSGLTNPPAECKDIATLRSFLSQVSPLPYDKAFKFAGEIQAKAAATGFPIEQIRIFVRQGEDADANELFKPYKGDFYVKRDRIGLAGFDEITSPTGRWWGWIGRKRMAGSFKDTDARGIRVRVRNIQIDDTKIIRDIFAVSYLKSKPRSSYARFAEWYIGEIFVQPEAAIPNARRDGFEETEGWLLIRDELDVLVCTRYGRLAYKTSTADQLSIESLSRRYDTLKRGADDLIAAGLGDWDAVAQSAAEATELQRRIALAVKAADDQELASLRSMATDVAVTRRGLESLARQAPPVHDCEEEVARALSDLTQRLYHDLKRSLAPAEWLKARAIVREATNEEPNI